MNVWLIASLGAIAGVCIDELIRYFAIKFKEERAWKK